MVIMSGETGQFITDASLATKPVFYKHIPHMSLLFPLHQD